MRPWPKDDENHEIMVILMITACDDDDDDDDDKNDDSDRCNYPEMCRRVGRWWAQPSSNERQLGRPSSDVMSSQLQIFRCEMVGRPS